MHSRAFAMYSGRRVPVVSKTSAPVGICQRRPVLATAFHAGAPGPLHGWRRVPATDFQQLISGPLGGQLTVGSVLGFATGYACKRVGQLLLVVIGVQVLALQLMERRGWVHVRWNVIGRDLSPHVEKNGIERHLDALKINAPFAGSFAASAYAGFRWT